MSEENEGKKDEAVGRIKEAAGALTDDDSLRQEGRTDQLVGKLKGKAAELVDDAREKLEKAFGGDDDDAKDEPKR